VKEEEVGRLCPAFGSSQVGDESYSLFNCPKYSILREAFHRKIEDHFPVITQLCTTEATNE